MPGGRQSRLGRQARAVDFELFRVELAAALGRSDRAKGGRPPYDAVLMLKILVLQTLYTLSDDQTEYQLRDRLSFMRFVGLGLPDPVPDAKHALGQAKPDPGDDLAVQGAADQGRSDRAAVGTLRSHARERGVPPPMTAAGSSTPRWSRPGLPG